MNEDNTKSKILRDFLELLGWDIAFDAELEYPVTIGSTKNYIDYSLSIDGSPVLFVEAKGYDTSIKDSHRNQLHSYLRQTDVDWGLLTNGGKYEIYRRENVQNGVEIRTVAEFELQELPNRTDYVGLLTRNALESGHSSELAERIFNIRRARTNLEESKDDLAGQITDILTSEVGDVISQEAQTESKEMIDRLIQELERQTEKIETKSSSDQNDFWKVVEERTGIVRTEDSVKLPDGSTATDDYVNFVRFLFDENHITTDDLPIESGRIRYILNTEEVHKNGSEMYNPKEPVDGVFLETHQNTEDKKRRITQLGERFGKDSS